MEILEKNKIYEDYILKRKQFNSIKLDKMIEKMIHSFIGYYKKLHNDISDDLKEYIKDVLYYYYFPEKIKKDFVVKELKHNDINSIIDFLFLDNHSKNNMKSYISDKFLSEDKYRYEKELKHIYNLWINFVFNTEQSNLFFDYVNKLNFDNNLVSNEKTTDISNNEINKCEKEKKDKQKLYSYIIVNKESKEKYYLNNYDEIRKFCKNMHIPNYRKFIKTKDTNKIYKHKWKIYSS